LRSDVEARVRLSGINVVPLEAFPTLDPYLYITINTAYEQPYLSYSVHIELNQLVYLGRNKAISCDATTWTRKKAGISGKAPTKSEIMENMHYLLESFLNDYAAGNHKEAATPQGRDDDGE